MHCPEHLVLDWPRLRVWHHQRADVRRQYVTWAEVLNPLRYELNIGAPGQSWAINDDAIWNRRWSNFRFHLRQMCWLRGHDWTPMKYSPRKEYRCAKCMKRRGPTS